MASAIFLSPWCRSEPIGGVTLTIVRDNTNIDSLFDQADHARSGSLDDKSDGAL